jgi:pterin-4a-carbinolamine dehydratase
MKKYWGCTNLNSESLTQGKESPSLTAEYAFKKFDQAVKFVGDVGAIAHDEDVRLFPLSLAFLIHTIFFLRTWGLLQHHPSTITITHGRKTTKVYLVTQTHAAKRPPSPPVLSESAESPIYVRVPGITIRDVRFAILVESHYSAGYEIEGLVGDKVHAARIDSEDVTGERWDRIADRLVVPE